VVGAFDTGRSRVQEGLELAGVEVEPRPLLTVVVERELLGALGTRPARSFLVLGPHVDALLG
jgi:hypothetical protein